MRARSCRVCVLTPYQQVGVGVLVCALIVWVVVRFDLSGSLGMWLRYDYLTGPCVIGGAYLLVSRLAGPARGPLLFALLFGVCALVLFGTWRVGVSDFSMIGGLLPYSDSNGYYSDALRLLHGHRFTDFSSRRPLFPAFFATLLFLTDADLRLVLLVTTALAVVTMVLAVREVERYAGTTTACVLCLCLFLYYRRYIGTVLTEHLGLMLGCLAFCLLWRGAATHHLRSVLGGLFVLSLGLNARAGAFLVLPAVLAWAAWEFRGTRRSLVRILGGGTAAVLLGFAINQLALHAVGLPGAAFSNFSYVLYGLVFGGNWTTALHQHPELAALPPLDQSARIYALAWEQIATHPLSLVNGSLRAWKAFFVGRSGTWFSFLFYLSPEWTTLREVLLSDGWAAINLRRDLWMLLSVGGRELWVIAMNALLVAGMLVLVRTPRSPLVRLHFAAWVGIVLSVPFAPPWDAENMRAYAATMPFLAGLPLMGVAYWRRRQGGAGEETAAAQAPGRTAAAVCAAGLVGWLVLGPPLVRGWAVLHAGQDGRTPLAATCHGAGAAALLSVDPRVAVHVVGTTNESRVATTGHALDGQSLRRWDQAKAYSFWHMWRGLSRLSDGTALAVAFDLRHAHAVYIQSDSVMLPPGRQTMAACGHRTKDGWIDRFVVTSLEGRARQ